MAVFQEDNNTDFHRDVQILFSREKNLVYDKRESIMTTFKSRYH
jgi:hypothetical protein